MAITKTVSTHVETDAPKVLKQFRASRIVWPILIGLGISGYLIWNSYEPGTFDKVNFTWQMGGWLLAALAMVVLRDIAYMSRIRTLTDLQISWKRSAVVILLWEFASAITPSIVGGTAFAFLLLAKEKISAGRTTAIVLLTAFLDELFFVLAVPIFLLIVGYDNMFAFVDKLDHAGGVMGFGLKGIFWTGYTFLGLYTLLLAYGLFINPKAIAGLIDRIFRLPFLRKWREGASKAGRDVVVASKELSGKKPRFWLKAFGATVISWTARYLIVNCILAAFATGVSLDHFTIYARQIFMWVILLIPVSPGGAGLAEMSFSQFLGEFVASEALVNPLGFLWRMFGYYPFLLIGAFLLPRWVRNKFGRRKRVGYDAIVEPDEIRVEVEKDNVEPLRRRANRAG